MMSNLKRLHAACIIGAKSFIREGNGNITAVTGLLANRTIITLGRPITSEADRLKAQSDYRAILAVRGAIAVNMMFPVTFSPSIDDGFAIITYDKVSELQSVFSITDGIPTQVECNDGSHIFKDLLGGDNTLHTYVELLSHEDWFVEND